MVRPDARVLILGSLPGDASLSANRYYAHPRNHFWALMAGVTGRDLPALEYAERLEALKMSGVALWDVVAAAKRKGSLDTKITDARLNDLRSFAEQLPHLQAVAFNGKKAAMLARNALAGLPVAILALPSSSPAHAVPLATKAAAWIALKRYLIVE